MNAVSRPSSRLSVFAAPPWLALLILVAGIVAPDCCLTGHHRHGAGMEAFGFICRARV
jgi:hypothetical protein